MPLADDDLLDPGYLETAAGYLDGADVVYSLCRCVNEDAAQFHAYPPGIPSTALIRRSQWLRHGGYQPRTHGRPEDNALWIRMLDHGCRFARIEQVNWTYRFNLGNGHRNDSRS